MGVGRITRRTVLAGAAAGLVLRSSSVGGAGSASPLTRLGVATEPSVRLQPPVHRLVGWKVSDIGRSVEGQPIVAVDARPPSPTRHVVVVCGIHGDERAAVELADGFGRVNRPDDLHLTLIPSLNPDGWDRGTRTNARGVDLNRNFSWGWQRGASSGRLPGSEPETAAVKWYLARTRPDLTIWVHKPLAYVAAIEGCPPWYADIWSEFSGVRVRPGVRQVGGGETWTAMTLARPAMLVEVGGTREDPIDLDRHVSALEALLFAVQPA